jgi:thiamine biosynthesis protein ThiS
VSQRQSGNRAIGQSAIGLVVNGKRRDFAGELTLPALLDQLGVNRKLIAVAHNGEVIPKASYEDIVLRDGDSVEIVRMVGGG